MADVEKEHILLEFEDGWVPAANTTFTLSGLDTMNPVLELEDGTKMVGRYEETMGTCILLSEHDGGSPTIEDQIKKSATFEPNPLYNRTFSQCNPGNKRMTPEPFCSLQRKLKFRAVENDENAKRSMP